MSTETTEFDYELRLNELEARIQGRINRGAFPLVALVFATLIGFFGIYRICVSSVERCLTEQVVPLQEEVKQLSARVSLLEAGAQP
jgi:hypothetical protein